MSEAKDYYAKDTDLLSVPRVYVYGPPFGTKQQRHPLLDLEFMGKWGGSEWRAWDNWYKNLRYDSPHGEFDLYHEPSNPGCPCATR